MFVRSAAIVVASLALAATFAGPAIAQPTIVSSTGYSITFNGNQQAFFSNTWDGTSQQAPNNIALSGQGSTAFASSEYGAGVHQKVYANDGVYGNNRSWLPVQSGTSSYVGVAFPTAQSLSSIAWGRDNGRNSTAVGSGGGGDSSNDGGQLSDRVAGTYTLQFTTVASPGTSTLDGNWTTIGTITLGGAAAGSFSPWFRHEYDVRTSAGTPISGVTGIRFVVNTYANVVDEIEVFRTAYWTGGSAAWLASNAWQTASSGGTSTTPFTGDFLAFAQATAGTQAVTLGAADRAARALSFTTADPVSLTAGGTDRTLTLGWAGDLTTSSTATISTLTMSGSAGAVTIGSQSAGEQVPISLNATQTWTNDSANVLTFHNAVSRTASDTTSRFLVVGGAGNTTINGPIADGGAAGTLGLTKSGSGTLTLTGSNSYTGASTFSTGTVAFNSSANQTLAGALSGAAAIVKGGAGTLALTGASTLSGTFTINSGTVQLGNTGQSAASRIVLANTAGANLALTGSEATIGLLTGGGTNGGNVQLNGATLRVAAALNSVRYNGVISGSGNLAVVGPLALRLTAVQTFTGSASVSAGYLVLEADNTLPVTTPLTMTGGFLDIFNRPQTLAGLGGSAGDVYSYTGNGGSGGVLTLDVASGASYAFGGRLGEGFNDPARGFSVVKTGSGTQIFSGSNSYTGATTISAGRLEIGLAGRINATSGITVNGASAELKYNATTALSQSLTLTRGTLSGTGAINSAVVIGSNAIHSPGNSPGIQTVASETWASGGTYLWELNSLTGTAGANWDQIAVTGTLGLGTLSVGGKFNLDLVTLTGGNITGPLDVGYVAGSTHQFTIATFGSLAVPAGFTTTPGSDLTSLFNISLTGWQGTKPNTSDISVRVNASSGLDLVIVPEPGALLLAGVGAALSGWITRRRR